MSSATWEKRRLAVVDIEGNGRQPPEIVEIAVVEINGLDVGGHRKWLVRPNRSISHFATGVHGITNEDVAGCSSWHDVRDDVRARLEGRVLVAHSASVERRVLAQQMPEWTPVAVLDTLQLARRLRPDLASYKLTALMDSFGLHDVVAAEVSTGPHSAAYDALGTAHLLIALVRRGSGSVISYDEVMNEPKTQTAQGDLFG